MQIYLKFIFFRSKENTRGGVSLINLAQKHIFNLLLFKYKCRPEEATVISSSIPRLTLTGELWETLYRNRFR